jgi:hypothetical protein
VFRRKFRKCERKLSNFVENTIKLVNMVAAKNAKGWGQDKPQWGEYKNVPYLLNVEHAQTNNRLFAFGVGGATRRGRKLTERAVSYLLREYQEKHGVESVMSTADLWKKVSTNAWWKRYVFLDLLQKAKKYEKKVSEQKKNNKSGDTAEVNKKVPPKYFKQEGEKDKEGKPAKQKLRLGRDKDRELCQKVVRAIASLELVLKDVDSDVVVRRGEKKDFVAALKLIEKTVLPTYFKIVFENDLFDDYSSVLPICSNWL